ncbi:GNAT family N-acetyltransferase [Catellatospora methionotrophica]|uniref:GNAT family N-acetyltransferase n=1 Tax=Catellatospora methionotrophica TaxID=121620 RepID=UPI0033EB1019
MTVTVTGLVLQPHDAAGMQQVREDLLDVYRDAYADKIANPFFAEGRFWERLEAYAARYGFELVTGHLHGRLVGYALGYTLPAKSAWWSGLLNEVDPELLVEDGRRTFALNYIMVRQAFRRIGIAEALHDALMGDRLESRATLLVLAENVAAFSAYQKWGWHRIGQLKPFDDAPTYEALVLDLTRPAERRLA